MRTNLASCNTIVDRTTCLVSIESRSSLLLGNQIQGNDCAWCPNGPCTSANSNRCEPRTFLDGSGVNDYETCVKGNR